MIDQLVSTIAQQLGIDQSIAEKAVGTVLSLLQDQGDSTAVAALFDKIPGAADLAGQFANSPADSGAGLGGLMGKLGGMMGGTGGDAMEAFGALEQTGLSIDQAKEMAPTVKDFLQQNAGEDTLSAVLESVPALKSLLG